MIDEQPRDGQQSGPIGGTDAMIHIPAELFIFLQQLDVNEHLTHETRHRLADARTRAAEDRLALERAWRTLDAALAAESRSRSELLTLTS